jgi:hypothetical protein
VRSHSRSRSASRRSLSSRAVLSVCAVSSRRALSSAASAVRASSLWITCCSTPPAPSPPSSPGFAGRHDVGELPLSSGESFASRRSRGTVKESTRRNTSCLRPCPPRSPGVRPGARIPVPCGATRQGPSLPPSSLPTPTLYPPRVYRFGEVFVNRWRGFAGWVRRGEVFTLHGPHPIRPKRYTRATTRYGGVPSNARHRLKAKPYPMLQGKHTSPCYR